MAAALALGIATSACRSGAANKGAAATRSTASAGAAGTNTTLRGPECSPARSASRTSALQHFAFQGRDRTYLLALPPKYDGHRAFPAVVSLAGFGSNVQAHEINTSIGRDGSARGFIVVTPAAVGNPAQWNIFRAKDQTYDYAFVHALLAELERRLCIDHSRLFAIGYSNGSAFAGFLACTPPNVFAAVAMVEATTPAGCPHRVAPSVIAIAGTADPAVLFKGGIGLSHIPIPPAVATIAAYAHQYQCDATPILDRAAVGVQRTSYVHCLGGAEVILDAVIGGTHDYPGGFVASHDATDSSAGRNFRATDQILEFFARHRQTWAP